MKNAEKQQRRAEIAKDVKKNKLTLAEAAKKYNVSRTQISIACKESGVTPQPDERFNGNLGGKRTLEVVRELMAGAKQADIARELGLHRQFVSIVANRAKAAGLLSGREPESSTLETIHEQMEAEIKEIEQRHQEVKQLDERYNAIVDHAKRHGAESAADTFQVSLAHVYNVLRAYKVIKGYRKASLATVCKVIVQAGKGLSPEDLATRFGITKNSAEKIVDNAKKAGILRKLAS